MTSSYDVVFVSSWLGTSLDDSGQTTGGGAEAQILMLAQGLAKRGHRVCIATWKPELGLPANVGPVDLAPFPRLDRWSKFAAISYLAYASRFVRALGRIRARNYVQRAASPDTLLVAVTARLRRARFVYSSAGLVDFDFAAYASRKALSWLYKLGYRLADAVVVQTIEQRRLSQQRLGRDAILIRSIAERRLGGPSEAEAFLWIGRLADYKRPEAYVELARTIPDARFWMLVARTEADTEAIAALERDCAEIPNLELLSARPRSEVLELISRSTAVVNTSDSEGMPNVFLEAWAQGVPTLSLSHDPDGIIARYGLGMTAGGSLQSLAASARELWASPEERQAIGERCREYVEREHDLDHVVDQWVGVLGLTPR